MDLLNERVTESQDLLNIDGLKHTDGRNIGAVWDRHTENERPIADHGTPVRYPVWDNYLKLAEQIQEKIRKNV